MWQGNRGERYAAFGADIVAIESEQDPATIEQATPLKCVLDWLKANGCWWAMNRSTHPIRASSNCRDGGPPVQARRCPTGGGQAKPPRCRWQPAGGSRRVDPRKPGAKRQAGDSSMGAKPWGALPGGTQDHPVSTVAAERGCGVDCKASKATSRNRVVLRRRRMTGPSRAARRPQADPAREAPTGAECKPVGRAGQAQPDRKVTSESDFGKVPLSRQFTGVTFR